MPNRTLKDFALASALMLTMANASFAGGLSDAIVEREPDVVAQTAPAAIPAWVLPAVGLLILGAVASSSGGGGGSSGDSSTPTPVTDGGGTDATPPGLGDIK